jgi:hypothetical protein
VLLVTHALHFLPLVDLIYTLEKGMLNEAGVDTKSRDDLTERLTLYDEPATSTSHTTELGAECGRIAEQGTYEQLLRAGGAFARLVEEFGSGEGQKNEEPVDEKIEATCKDSKSAVKKHSRAAGTGKLEGKLMQAEKRTTGSVEWTGELIYFLGLIRC